MECMIVHHNQCHIRYQPQANNVCDIDCDNMHASIAECTCIFTAT